MTGNQVGGNWREGVAGSRSSYKGQVVGLGIGDGVRKEGRTLGEFACYAKCRGIDGRIFCRGYSFI